MKTSSIRVEGNIISPELFDKLDTNEVHGQTPADFGFDRSIKVKDEIARAWADAKDQWNIFKRRTEKLKENQSGVEETRKYWIIPLLENLGYKPEFQRSAEIVNSKSYQISHRDSSFDSFPVHIMGINDNLDKKRESGGPRMSPHALLQEYINVTEHLYGIVTNGLFLRILRDSGKLVRLSYLEFNLQRMLEDDLYAEFSIMYRLIHSSRMPHKQTEAEQCIFEQYHQDAIESGSRIRERLSAAVEKSIKTIANGFLSHPANEELRSAVKDGKLPPEKYFLQLLRFIYRILFLLVIEERDIVYPEIDKDTSKEERVRLAYLKNIYYSYYSISRLRKLAEKIYFFDDKLEDLWISLKNTFIIFEEEKFAQKLGVYPLGGDLFSSDAIGLLSISQLSNKNLLECIKNLSLFESQNRQILPVNYAALNVEEFGSVYEGLLEYNGKFSTVGGKVSFEFVESSARSSSGSHYTPEELVQPLIKHSLEYVIEEKLTPPLNPPIDKGGNKRGSQGGSQEQALLSIKVCDVACGSGHILLSAARRIALELTRVRTGEDQPSPGPYREALRDVIDHCIYGVDKNPLAVELCKVALWLEAYNPGKPLNFLDHKIKCGDSIVGLARIEDLNRGIAQEAFKKMPGDDPEVVKFLSKKNKEEAKTGQLNLQYDRNAVEENVKQISTKFKEFEELPENTLEDVKKKAEKYNVMKDADWWHLKEAADLQVAQFFILKSKENKDKLATHTEFFNVLGGTKAGCEQKIAMAMAVAAEKKFFHWFLEFPEVLAEGGFDCILGNPPFLGGKRISSNYSDTYLLWLKTNFEPDKGIADLVAYFFRKNFQLLKTGGFLSLISTNTISQGGTRETGLEPIIKSKGNIINAQISVKWPGQAAVYVTLIAITKGVWNKYRYLNNKVCGIINEYLSNDEASKPLDLISNKNKCFVGSYVLGMGFILSHSEANEIIAKNDKYKKVIFEYINGEDLNGEYDQKPNRQIINFFDWSLEVASQYEIVFELVEKIVKPERLLKKEKKLSEKWWQYARRAEDLYKACSALKNVIVTARTSKTLAFELIKNNKVFSSNLTVIASCDEHFFAILQSTLHNIWAWKYSTTLKTDLIYAPQESFETFPFPEKIKEVKEGDLLTIAMQYRKLRKKIMLNLQLGLTKTYNLFHNPECNSGNIEKAKEIKEIKQANLQIPIEQAIKDIETLRQLHKEMDETVLKAYGWGFDQAQPEGYTSGINLMHDFYEVDYLPENDRIRYTISPEARKEVLKRLLELNHKIHAEEVAAGLWDKKNKKLARRGGDKKVKSAPPAEDEGQEKLKL